MKKDFEYFWIKIKIWLHLPFPLKSFYYKGRRISILKNNYCKACKSFFDIPKENMLLSEVKCPECSSKSFYWSKQIFKAAIDKKSIEDIELYTIHIDKETKLIDKYFTLQKNNGNPKELELLAKELNQELEFQI